MLVSRSDYDSLVAEHSHEDCRLCDLNKQIIPGPRAYLAYFTLIPQFLLVLVAFATANAFAQEISPTGGPDRSIPPKLSDFISATDLSSQLRTGLSLSDVEQIAEENRRLKLSLQGLQLERIEILMQDKTERGNVLKSSVWQNRTIEVHWENPEAAPDEEREWVREAIERTWVKNSGLKFVGWNKATASSNGIRIKIAEEGPHCKRLGRHLDGLQNGMVLNFTFRTWCTPCALDRKGSIEKIAVHEFGHAIGFAHEQNRTEAPEWCKNERQGTYGDWYVTIYDPDSIMNYCNSRWQNGGLLSPLDIRTVQVLYGSPNPEPIPEDEQGDVPAQR